MNLRQITGDVFDELPRLEPCAFHGALVDPPYLISFMGRAFDRQHKRFKGVTEAEKALGWNLAWLRVLLLLLVPGAYAAIFQGSKTYHRLAFASELAGFEVLPMIVGICGKAMAQGGAVGKLVDREAGATRAEVIGTKIGLPGKALDYSNQAFGRSNSYGAGGQLSPDITAPSTPLAHDFEGHHSLLRDQLMPVALLRKPLEGSLAANAARWGVAGLNTDGCRAAASPEDVMEVARHGGADPTKFRRANGQAYGTISASEGSSAPNISRGRFPGNVLLDEAAAEEVGEKSGETRSGGWPSRRSGMGYGGGNGTSSSGQREASVGTAARYFNRFRYVGRAPPSERLKGLEHWHWVGDPADLDRWRRLTTAEAIELKRTDPRGLMTGSNHPTMKALELTRWIARLILPSMGPEAAEIRQGRTRLLVPFSGVLSEVIGAAQAGWPEAVAIESNESYLAQGAARFEAWAPYPLEEADREPAQNRGAPAGRHEGQGSLFG